MLKRSNSLDLPLRSLRHYVGTWCFNLFEFLVEHVTCQLVYAYSEKDPDGFFVKATRPQAESLSLTIPWEARWRTHSGGRKVFDLVCLPGINKVNSWLIYKGMSGNGLNMP